MLMFNKAAGTKYNQILAVKSFWIIILVNVTQESELIYHKKKWDICSFDII